jgi:N6-L-threonylcarbamoyladenine synthase
LIFWESRQAATRPRPLVVRRFADGIGEILADVVLSQLDLHSAFGGVVPELAARSHVSTLDRLVEQALKESGVPLTASMPSR